MKGVPLRLEIGPRDIESNQCVLVSRVDRSKDFVSLDGLEESIKDKLTSIRDAMYQKALDNRTSKTYDCKTLDEIASTLEEKGMGFVRAMWCGDEACEDKVKEITGVGSRCIPFDQEKISESCVCCGKPAETMVLWGKAY